MRRHDRNVIVLGHRALRRTVLAGGLIVPMVVLTGCAADQIVATGAVAVATSPPHAVPASATTHRPWAPRKMPQLERGAKGPAVVRLQSELRTLGYWLGAVDGRFGDATQQAVFALQKVAGISHDGVVGRKTWRALRQGVRPSPRSRYGTRVEVDLEHDVLMFVSGGELRYTLNTSTGGGYTYYEYGAAHVAVTPTGRFRVYNQINGLRVSPLGEMWRPKYFHDGYAIHGDAAVPPYPVSHGCVRVSNEAIDWIWAKRLLPIGSKVWIYR